VELIGKANLRTVGLFQKRTRSQAPFLHRHYPASTVIRACPPPHTAEPAPHGVLVESHDLSPLGLPVFRSISSSRHADATTPAEPLGAVAFLSNGHGLPLNPGGSASATSLFGACSAFTRVSACLVARSPKVTFTRVLQRIRYLLRRPGCFRPSDRLAGWDSHPLEIADLHGVLSLETPSRMSVAVAGAVRIVIGQPFLNGRL
jgi:hypothetical protein